MGERRDRNNRRWAQATSLIPIFGKHISQGIMQNSLSRNQREAAAKINPIDVEYKESPYAKEQLATARNFMNAKMPGSQQAEANTFRNQSNTMMNLARAASSPQQMMAAAGAVQGQTNNALNNLAQQEAQYRTGMLGNLNNALQGMVTEGNKVYADQTNRFNRLNTEKQNLLNASQQNFSNSLQSASGAMNAGVNAAISIFGGGAGGLGSLFGGMSGGSGGGQNLGMIADAAGGAQVGGFNPAASGWFTPTRRP